jgi:hypothetical protein
MNADEHRWQETRITEENRDSEQMINAVAGPLAKPLLLHGPAPAAWQGRQCLEVSG